MVQTPSSNNKILGLDIENLSEAQLLRLEKGKPVAAFSTKSTIDLINVSFKEDTLYPLNRILGKNKVRFYGYEELVAGGLDELELEKEGVILREKKKVIIRYPFLFE